MKRIVLVDSWGDELFSGVSLAHSLPPSEKAPESGEDECPPTKRSHVFESGMYPVSKSAARAGVRKRAAGEIVAASVDGAEDDERAA